MAEARMNSSGQQVSVKVKTLEDKVEQLTIEISKQKKFVLHAYRLFSLATLNSCKKL